MTTSPGRLGARFALSAIVMTAAFSGCGPTAGTPSSSTPPTELHKEASEQPKEEIRAATQPQTAPQVTEISAKVTEISPEALGQEYANDSTKAEAKYRRQLLR